MHPYSINSSEHKRITFYLAIVSILFALLLSSFSEYIYKIPWWIESPSVIGFYGILYKFFDVYLWKVKIFREYNIIKTPLLDGEWEGDLISSSLYLSEPIKINVKIRQTWTQIRIFLKTNNSESYSFDASIIVDQFDTPRLNYQYINTPIDNTPDSMHIHSGAVIAKLINKNKIEAEYFSGRDRKNNGSFILNKCELQR